jgi:1,2-diacylglycerol 3-beta-glucosyltransferase
MPRVVDVTWLGYLLIVAVTYYLALFVLKVLRPARPGSGPEVDAYRPLMVLIVPAHNEERVIAQTLRALTDIDYEAKLVLVMNDGSTDATSELARTFEAAGVAVVDRPHEVSGQGKGAVLNHAFSILRDLARQDDGRLNGFAPNDVLIGIMDADGQLEGHALTDVARYFADPTVGGVQIGVRIANARDNLLARMQDIEFIGFSGYVQEARDFFGSVGLGGNGQFTRLSALLELERDPWTHCLTEDLDLSLSLVQAGWRIRFCPTAFVAQQGLTKVRPLLRQRTRWVQGHYQCWRHLPGLMRNRSVPLKTRVDLSTYLLMITFTMVVFAGVSLSLLQLTGLYSLSNNSLGWCAEGWPRNLIAVTLSFAPPLMFLATYQRRAQHRLAVYEIPTYLLVFSLFGYHWIFSQLWAWCRMATRRSAWAKTPRTVAEAAV